MGILDGLLGGGSSLDIYGDLFTDAQKEALRSQQLTNTLAKLSQGFAQAAMPSRMPIPFGAALGQAAGAAAGGQDEASERMIKAMQVAEQVRQSRQEREILQKYGLPMAQRIAAGLGVPVQTVLQHMPDAAPGAAGAPAAAPPGSNAPPPPREMGLPGPGTSPLFGLPDAPGAAPALPPEITTIPGFEALPGGGFKALPQQQGLLGKPDEVIGQTASLDPGLLNPAIYGGGTGSPDPFGSAAPGAAGEVAGGLLPDPDRRTQIRPVSGEAAPADKMARDLALVRKYESGDRNIEQGVVGPQGGYNPSVGRVTGPSSASGYYQMIDPTWRSAAAMAGIDTAKYPRAIDAPEELQRKAAEALYQKEGLAPWAPYNSRLAAATGYQAGGRDTVIPSGQGLPASALQRVADTGGGPLAAPPGAGAALATPPGTIPGTNVTAQQLAALNAILKMSGMKSDVFGSLLEGYYKSPEYITQSAAAAELGKLPFEGPKAAAVAKAQQKYIQENQAHQSDLDIAKELLTKGGLVQMPDGSYKQIKTITDALAAVDIAKQADAASREIVTVTVTPPGANRPQEMQMTKAQAKDVVEGRGVPALGIPAMSGAKVGKPVFSPGEAALGPVEAKDIFEKHQAATDAAMTIETNKEARALLDAGVFTGAGADRVTALAKIGNALKLNGKTTQETVANTEAYLATTAGNVGRMIKQFGSGTGLSDADREYAAQMAAGKTTLDEISIRRILDINDRASMNIINRHNQRVSKIAPGATMTDLNVPVPTPYERQWKEGDTVSYPDGSKRVLTGGQWFEVQTPGGKR